MNENAVYVKTEAGEEAVTKRTIVQRNLRSILIMVDGRTPVVSLAQQFGDPLIVEGLIGELEHRGLVRRVDAPNPSEAADRAELSSMLVDIEDLVSQPITPVADDIRRAHEKSSSPESPVLDEFAMALPELAAPAPAGAAAPVAVPADDVRSAIRRAMMSASAAESAPVERPEGPLRRLFNLFAGRVGSGERRGPPGSLGRRLFVGALVFVLLLVGTFFLYPYNRHLPHIEEMATELLGHPVHITSVSPSLLPEPSIALEGVTVGASRQLQIGAVKLLPRVSTLLSERTVLREVRIEQAGLDVSFLPILSHRQDINWASRWVKVERVSVIDSSLTLLDGAIGRLAGDLAIDDNGVLTRLSLNTPNGGLKLQGVNESGTWKVSMTALGWETPGHPSLLFDVFEAQGTLSSRRLQLDKVDVKLYDGYATGTVALDFGDAPHFEGQVMTSRLGLAGLLKVLAPTLRLTGDLSMSLALTADGADFETLRRNLRGTGTLGVQRGQIERVDLVQAVRIPRPGGVRGGSTRFDRLEGDATVDGSGLSLGRVSMESGLVGAQGALRLAEGRFDGRLDVTLQGSATTVRAPVGVEGAYADPVVKLLR